MTKSLIPFISNFNFRILCCLTIFMAFPYCSGAGIPANEPYSLSYAAGGYDASGNFLGGTEIMNLVAFQGRLYAGVGYWMDRPRFFPQHPDPASGAQILVLDSSRSSWRQEVAFNQQNEAGNRKYERLSTMLVVQFHRFDAAGNVLGPLAEMLVVGLDSPNGAVYTQSSPGVWEDTLMPNSFSVRSIAVHYDPIERTEKLYAGAGPLQGDVGRGIYSGIFDPSAPGRIRWSQRPEPINVHNRIMSMVECDGALFAAAKPSILRRNDQTKTWEVIYTHPMNNPFDQTKYTSGFRGLTRIGAPSGKQFILSAFEGVSGDILRIDPVTGTAVVELSCRQFLTRVWGGPLIKPDIIAGYNDIPFIANGPIAMGGIRLFGLLAYPPGANEGNSAWFLSRATQVGQPTRYELHEVKPLGWPFPRSDSSVYSVRTIAVSPFPDDQGQVLYMGGYDGHFQPDHNTAWIYRVGAGTALSPYNSGVRKTLGSNRPALNVPFPKQNLWPRL
jgi:hypothetical protein